MKTKKGFLGTFAAVSLLLVTGAASAAPISGDITFFGAWEAKAADGVTVVSSCCFGTAAHIAFVGDVLVSQAIGDFDGAAGLYAPYTDFTFDPFVGPIAPLWTLTLNGTTFSFSLERVTVSLQTTHQLALQGFGTLSAPGFDDTAFAWSFSGDHTGALLSFSAASFNVPEPSVVGLLGLGLIAMGAVGVRRRRTAFRV
jgi:hypothetical protein